MSLTIMEQALAFRGRYMGILAISYLDDFNISPSEQKRLDAVKLQIDQIDQKVKDLDQEAQKKLDKAMKDVVSKLKTDPAQVKAFQDAIKALSPDVQMTAIDVLNTLCGSPRPADPKTERAQIRNALAKFPQHSMAVGKALNAIGVYIPNLKEDSPGAEDASARIKKVHMSGEYQRDSVQADYIRDLIAQAKQQNFKVVLQIKKGADAAATKKIIDDLKTKIAADMAGTIADVKELEKYVEVLPADKSDYIWAEDNKWLSADGTTIRTTPEISRGALTKLDRFTTALKLKPGDPGFAREGHHTAAQKHNDPGSDEFPSGLVEEGSAQGAVASRKEHLSAQALAKATGKKVVTTRTYNEGGNMLVGTLPNGQPYGVVGRDGVLVSVFHLQEEYNKNPAKVPEFAPANVAKRMGTMTFDADEVAQTIQQLTSAGMMPAAATTPAKKENEAKLFLAKVDLVKDIYAADTEIPRDQLIFVPQPDFHVDMHMRPAGPGQIMVNDFKANIALIDDALKRATPGSWEAKQLQSMRDHAAKMDAVMGPVIDEIAKKSKEGGLEVVRAPGVMEGQFDGVDITPTTEVDLGRGNVVQVGRVLGLSSNKQFTREELGKALLAKAGASPTDDDRAIIDYVLDELFTRHVNFMNAIPGTKDGTNEQFYMTNFTSIKPLREAYEAYLKSKGIESVQWIGDDGGTRLNRSASEQSLQLMGGLDCRENH